ncbi:hypothetical protein OVA29_01510 [Exiguobacterium sp. SL14]|nr:hypothetical protein [Exiguobacterium sp. SL14]MCY1689687.1 hypothetical protein [Exiguobacterium sp. SL14]
MTLLPALLIVFGKVLEKGRLFRQRAGRSEDRWRRLARFVMKRPIAVTVLSLLLLLPCLLPLRDLTLNIPQATALPESYPSRLAFESWEKTFGNDGTDAVLILSADASSEVGREKIEDVTIRLESDPEVRSVVSAVTIAEQQQVPLEQLLAVPAGVKP